MPARRSTRRSPAAGYVYIGLSALIAMVLVSMALTAAQSPPPAIAELAPDAVEQIKDAPVEQSSDVGTGEGGGGLGGATTTTTTTTPATTTTLAIGPDGMPIPPTTAPRIERARVRRCVGSPPRQIEDPQSPPCVPFFEGDNGGATTRGVSADGRIKVMVPDLPQVRVQLQNFFNNRFEFYGRKLDLVPLVTGSLCQHMKDGAARAEEAQAFAALSLFKSENCYMEALARRQVVGIPIESVFTEAQLAEFHPYVFAYPMANDDLLTGIGQWTCARLAGKTARFADGVDVSGRPMSTLPRSFGIITQPYAEGWPLDTTALKAQLSRCGVKVAAERQMRPQTGDSSDATNSALEMKSKGVTSVICLCGYYPNLYLPAAATSQQYFPEWLVSSYALSDNNINIKTFWSDAQQRNNLLGVTIQPRQWRLQDTPVFWAVQEVDPNWENAQKGYTAVAIQEFNRIYRMLLVLASGIQAAGPNLTPETFARGLQSTAFPNPSTPPLLAGAVGFSRPDHSMTDDFAEYYWSEAGVSPYEDSAGSLCWVDRGARRRLGQWPAGDDVFFQLDCDSGNRSPG